MDNYDPASDWLTHGQRYLSDDISKPSSVYGLLKALDYIKARAANGDYGCRDLHDEEDALYHNFVYLVAGSGGDLASLAQKVLGTEDIEMDRWYE